MTETLPDFDPACAAHIPVDVLLGCDSLPIRRTADGIVVATSAATRPPLSDWFPGERLLTQQVDRPAVQELTIDSRTAEVADEMANGFTRRHPELAARTGIATWQKLAAGILGIAGVAALVAGQTAIIAAVIGVVFAAAVLLKILLAAAAGGHKPRIANEAALSDEDLPTYTVLIPAYHEEAVIGDTIRCVANIDYPRDKLEVLVLLERRDKATIRAVQAVDPPDFVRIVLLPPGRPQTKPRACNLGLLLARGEILVIFDAEDRPERDQLRKVAHQFAAGGDRLACIQAKLNFYNAGRNLLTRMFSLEFAFWFDLLLVGLGRSRLPVPLGGTSNHLRTDVLRTVGGWDAWNVTEDADLGLRLASAGYHVDVADSTTWEECPARPWAWITQRTRWLKGYLLTLLVHTRNPVAATRRFGWRGIISLLGVVGGTPLVFLMWPFAVCLWLAGGARIDPAGAASTTQFVAATMVLTALLGAVPVLLAGWRRRLSWPMALFFPVYWLLHAFAAWRGFVQLLHAPYKWEKTEHHASAAPPSGDSARVQLSPIDARTG